jgi:signal transduction histidine kinase
MLAAIRAAVELASPQQVTPTEAEEERHRVARPTAHPSQVGENVPAVWGEPAQMAADRYVAAFRSALLDEALRAGPQIDGSELARVLATLDAASGGFSSSWRDDFIQYLTGVNAVNAVVEIAHDMRSPLTSILFLVDILRRGKSGVVTVVQERQLGLIYGAALGLNALASDVIDTVRGGQRLVEGHPVPFSITEVVDAVCDTVRPISEEKGVPIRKALRAADGRSGYPSAIGRVMLNLMTNALKYTNEGYVEIGCSEVTDSSVSFWVKDTGGGIPRDVMSMLFDGFRPSASGMRFSNAGLGLAICQNFLAAMGTTLAVESSAQSGTRFSFEIELPRA